MLTFSDKKQHKSKLMIVAAVCIFILLLLLICSSISRSAKADEIYDNLIGKTYSGSESDDHGYSSAVSSGKLSSTSVYYESWSDGELYFAEDGTVERIYSYGTTWLAYPDTSSSKNLENTSEKSNYTYDSFKIKVSFGGDVTLDFGNTSFPITVSDENKTTAINDFYGMTLKATTKSSSSSSVTSSTSSTSSASGSTSSYSDDSMPIQ